MDLAVGEGREFAARLLDEHARAVLHECSLEVRRVRVERVDLALGEGGVLLAPVEDDEREVLVDVEPFAREERAEPRRRMGRDAEAQALEPRQPLLQRHRRGELAFVEDRSPHDEIDGIVPEQVRDEDDRDLGADEAQVHRRREDGRLGLACLEHALGLLRRGREDELDVDAFAREVPAGLRHPEAHVLEVAVLRHEDGEPLARRRGRGQDRERRRDDDHERREQARTRSISSHASDGNTPVTSRSTWTVRDLAWRHLTRHATCSVG